MSCLTIINVGYIFQAHQSG